ncbi:MAG: LysO family transporter [Desulfovibrio sp.]
MLAEVGCILVGIPLGFLLRRNERAVRCVDSLTMWAIYGLLFLLGVSIGSDNNLVSQMETIGLRALVISLSCVLGSAAAVWFLDKFILKGALDER